MVQHMQVHLIIAYLSCLPNFIVMAAGDEQDLRNMIKTSLLIDDYPSSFRYPRGSTLGLDISEEPQALEIGKGRILNEGNDIALVNFGARLGACIEVKNNLAKKGINITIVDSRFAKPLDTKLIDKILDNHSLVITIEEGSIGGFGSIVLDYIHNKRKKNTKTKVQNIIFPDIFVEHNSSENQYKFLKMDANSIEEKLLNISFSKRNKFKKKLKYCNFYMKKRIDLLLVEKNLAETRSKAQAIIMAGQVYVDDKLVTKSGQIYSINSTIIVKNLNPQWVSRGAYKLIHAIKYFNIKNRKFDLFRYWSFNWWLY